MEWPLWAQLSSCTSLSHFLPGCRDPESGVNQVQRPVQRRGGEQWPLGMAPGDGPASVLGQQGCQVPGTCQVSPLPAAPWDQQLPSWSQGAIVSEQLGRAGWGGAGMKELLMGRKSFGWPHARALGGHWPSPQVPSCSITGLSQSDTPTVPAAQTTCWARLSPCPLPTTTL